MSGQRVDEQKLNDKGDWLTPITNTWAEVNSYIPDAVKSSIAANLPSAATRGTPTAKIKDLVLATSFDSVMVGSRPHLCLVVCYDNGFQVCLAIASFRLFGTLIERASAIAITFSSHQHRYGISMIH